MHNGPKSPQRPQQSVPQSMRMIREDDIPTRGDRTEALFAASGRGEKAQKSNLDLQRRMISERGWLV